MSSCEYCGEEFSSPKDLEVHKATVHATGEAESSLFTKYTCSKCGEVFRSPAHQAEHMKLEHPEVIRRISIIYWTILIVLLLIAIWQFF